MCAGLQGRFWEMNDALFSIQETMRADDVAPVALAVRLGLDRSDFRHCLEQHTTAEHLANDIRDSIDLALTGTPTFVVNERLFPGGIPAAELDRLLSPEP